MNKIERVNLHWDDIMEILNGFAGAVPHGTVESFQNPSILLLLDDDRVLRCLIKPEMEWRLLGVPFADPFTGLGLWKRRMKITIRIPKSSLPSCSRGCATWHCPKS
jgi:hypothetical protein